MYLVAACENDKIAHESIRVVKNEKLVIKHLGWLAKNFWPISMTLDDFLRTEWFVVLKMQPNSLKEKGKSVNKSSIKRWIQDEKFDKITITTKHGNQINEQNTESKDI